jgi:hypothetical protein
MNEFTYCTLPDVRAALVGEPDEAKLALALDQSQDALAGDYESEMVSSRTYSERERHFDDAEAAFEAGDLEGAQASLKAQWSA